ncbi:MAG: 6-bladed beta-propeller [Candidatus Aminicenantes bacterium]|nr:6-bladed beta-propeller [Candidatus Aminicenantes bacterium]
MNTKSQQKVIVFLWMISFFYLQGISNPSTDEYKGLKKEIKAELLFSIGSDKENEDFYNPKCFTVDNEGNIYILDSGNSRIQVFSSQGSFLFSFGKFGQGPGELSKRASKLKLLDDENLYVIDNIQHRIIVYSTKGEYLTSHKIYSSYDDIVLNSNTYYLSNLILEEKHNPIHFSNDLEKIKKSFGNLIEPTQGIIKLVKNSPIPHILKNEFLDIDFTNIIVNSKGNIIYSQRNPYHIVKYNKKGQQIKDIIGDVGFNTHFPLKIEFAGKAMKKRVTPPISSVYETMRLEKDKFIVPILSPDRSFFYLDMYNSDCIQISRYKLPNIFFDYKKKAGITNIHIDQNYNFYCLVRSREEMPRLSKYKLIFN